MHGSICTAFVNILMIITIITIIIKAYKTHNNLKYGLHYIHYGAISKLMPTWFLRFMNA